MVPLLVLDPLVSFGVRRYHHRCCILADLQVFQFWLFGGDSTSWFRSGGFGSVGGQQGHGLFGSVAAGLRPAYRPVVCRVDHVYPALVPYETALALEV